MVPMRKITWRGRRYSRWVIERLWQVWRMAVAGKAGGKVAHATSGVKGIQIHFLQIKREVNRSEI